MFHDLIETLEPLAVSAWPAAEYQDLDGWLLRFSRGVTRRANSVLPSGDTGQLPLADKVQQVEQAYRARGLPACFHISPAAHPRDLDPFLSKRGYNLVTPTCTQTAAVNDVQRRTSLGSAHRLTLHERCEDRWFDTYCRAEQIPAAQHDPRREILQRIVFPTAYALVEINGEPIATGLGVLQDAWLGVFSVATEPSFRRRGAARAVLHALAQWGIEQRASRMYLQALTANRPAQSLYAQAGFSTAFCYHYRQLG